MVGATTSPLMLALGRLTSLARDTPSGTMVRNRAAHSYIRLLDYVEPFCQAAARYRRSFIMWVLRTGTRRPLGVNLAPVHTGEEASRRGSICPICGIGCCVTGPLSLSRFAGRVPRSPSSSYAG